MSQSEDQKGKGKDSRQDAHALGFSTPLVYGNGDEAEPSSHRKDAETEDRAQPRCDRRPHHRCHWRPPGPPRVQVQTFRRCLQVEDGLGTHLPCSQYEWTHSRLVLSHSLTVLSSLADTMSRPSGENLNQAGHKSHDQLTDTMGATWHLPQPPSRTAHYHLIPGISAATCPAVTQVTLGKWLLSVR
ncbi:hypothetical protein PAL_GLEAN10009270 [Pteropus alecto]|uniref:Uncharacterized protein n=1 Tax=Pteropus alecto TaxID=9402 RepID=L5KUR8_PTEAL|nr:hypothetical protein PAL_GLEAN10009270 [Pteropus alecto]